MSKADVLFVNMCRNIYTYIYLFIGGTEGQGKMGRRDSCSYHQGIWRSEPI